MRVSIQSICCLALLQSLSVATSIALVRAQEPAKPSGPAVSSTADEEDKPVKEPAAKDGWRPLIKSNSLDGWEITQFGGEGDVKVVDGQLVLGMGDPLTGITWKAKNFPTSNFEIKLEAQRIQGNDFLCGLTFPIGDDHASLICGGWGGGVVGLSSVDGNDASENSTSTYLDFKNGQWYSFRVRVDDENVTAWVDDERIFKQERKGRDFSVRAEVMSSRPLGFCVFQSKVAVRNLAWRPLDGKGDGQGQTKSADKAQEKKAKAAESEKAEPQGDKQPAENDRK